MKRIFPCMILCGLAFGQSRPDKLSFEVASVRPGPPGNLMELAQSGKMFLNIDDTRVSMGSISLPAIIQRAYEVPQDQISGPDWLMEQRFDVQAKLPAGARKEQVPEMLRTLLAERFRLAVHHDPRTLPVYTLTIAKDGPKFHESTEEDRAKWGCNGGFHKLCRHVGMQDLAIMLTRFSRMPGVPGAVDRPVVDMTGLTGVYDFDFDNGRVGGGRGVSAEPGDDEIISAFDGVKRLGLKLEPGKHTYDYIVIDHVEKVPTEN